MHKSPDEIHEFLDSVKYSRQKIYSNVDMIACYRSLAEKTTTTLSPVPGGKGEGNPREDAILKKLELEGELREEIKNLREVMTAAVLMINSLKNNRHRNVLTLKYINGMTWAEVAERLGYAEATVYKIRREALEELSRES